jgi:hypothetical protein
VRQFDFWRSATATRNRRFPGVRQPGSYEIDIAFEVFLEPVWFRLIVECKNHKRRVTRPVVQQLEKAAIASPTGFSDEAMQVAPGPRHRAVGDGRGRADDNHHGGHWTVHLKV